MDTKNKIIKTARICYIIAKILYCLAFIACLTFVVLAIVLSQKVTIKSLLPAEVGMVFGTLALYAFVGIGLLWNVEGIFKSIAKEQSPFSESVSHYLKKIAVFIILISIVPALIGSTCLRIMCPESEIVFPIEFGGVIAGIVLFLIGMFFTYGKELQKKDDETL